MEILCPISWDSSASCWREATSWRYQSQSDRGRTVTGEKEPRRDRVSVISMCVYRLIKETDLQEQETVGDEDGRNEGRHQALGCSSFVIVKTETDFVEASYLDSRS